MRIGEPENFQEFIEADGDQLSTTSNQIAFAFGKRHDNVLRIIRTLADQLPPEFNALNFEAVTYLDEKGESRVMYRVSRDGFALLAMGFTGKKALAFKVAYIDAFNAMAAHIKSQRESLSYQCMEIAHSTRDSRDSLQNT